MAQNDTQRLAAVIGSHICRELRRLGETHDWLASQIQRERATVGFYVNGLRLPPVNVLVRISKALGNARGSVDWLLGIPTPGLSEGARRVAEMYDAATEDITHSMMESQMSALLEAEARLKSQIPRPAP